MRVSPLLSLPIALLLASHAVAEGRTAAEAAADGNRLLAQGAYSDAARAYSDAIDADPSGYVNYYKRATAYLSLGRHTAALDDFDAILRLNPGFSQAHFQKAKILAKEGEFDAASAELKAFSKSKSDPDAEALARSVHGAAADAKAARAAAKKRKWQDCVDHATKAIEVGPNSASMRDLRVECQTEMGNIEAAYADMSRLAMLNPSSQELRLKLANLAFYLLDPASALAEVKKCLHFDPDSKPCKALHKELRKFDKESTRARNFVEGRNPRKALQILRGEDGLIAKFEASLATAVADGTLPPQFDAKTRSETRKDLYALGCRAIVDANEFSAKYGAVWCDTLLELDADNEHALVYRGEKMLKEEKWDEAVRFFQRAFEHSRSEDIMRRMQKAERLLKVSKQKDYYKVLGVARDADERTIKKAFRKAAKQNHPDVGGSEEKMAAINEAYEVLSDSELRARYDNGDDPNDPSGGAGGNPFAHHAGGGGMPFFFQQGFQGGGFPGGGFPGGGGQKMHFQWG